MVLLLFLGKRKEEKIRIKNPQSILDYLKDTAGFHRGDSFWRRRADAAIQTEVGDDPVAIDPRDNERKSRGRHRLLAGPNVRLRAEAEESIMGESGLAWAVG